MALRRIGSIAVVVGVLLIAYAAAVILWRDPVTDLYARWQQQRLAASLEQTFAEYRSAVVPLTDGRRDVKAERKAVADAARGFATSLELGEPLGRIRIPRLELTKVFVHGTRWREDLSRGPGHYPETSLPGLDRTFAIAGHRTTFGAPFRHIDTLRAGDLIEVNLPYGSFSYRVFGQEIVDADDWSVVRRRGFDTLVLSACHPLYSSERRWIVYARLTVVKPSGLQPYILPTGKETVTS